MIKKFGRIKATLLIGLLLFSILAAIAPSTSAGKIVGLSSLVNVTWGTETQEPIIPRQDLAQFDLYVNYSITKGWFLADVIYNLYIGRQVNINLEIIDYPEWSTVSLSQRILTTSVPEDSANIQELKTKVIISVDQDAPAFAQGKITVRATVESIGAIDGFEQEFDIPFQPGYFPLISCELPETNIKRISPYNETTVPINVTNLGNAKSKIFAEILEAPENWTASIQNITLDGFGETGQTYLKVIADHKFDEERIRISFTPAYFDNSLLQGKAETLTLIFENDGSYVEEKDDELEIDTTMLIIILIGIIAIIILIAVIIKLRKTKNN